MLLFAVLLLAIFILIRFITVRYTSGVIATLAAVAAVGFFGTGVLLNPVIFDTSVTPATPSAPVTGNAPAVPPATLNKLKLPEGQVAKLTRVSGDTPLGSIDAITTSPTALSNSASNDFASGSTLFVRGWAAEAAKSPLRGIVLVVDYKQLINATKQYGGDRPDVANAFSSRSMEFTGFSGVPLVTAGMAKGVHTIQIAKISDDGKHYAYTLSIVKFTLE
jgi:hypothetical protein